MRVAGSRSPAAPAWRSAPLRLGSDAQEAAQRQARAERGHADRRPRAARRSAPANEIVRGAEISDQSLASGSSSATLASPSTAIASSAPAAPTTIPSITNGQRMNQSVAPTSFITSTSRRRAIQRQPDRVADQQHRRERQQHDQQRRGDRRRAFVTSRIFLVSPVWLETLGSPGRSSRAAAACAHQLVADHQHVARIVRDHVEGVGQRVAASSAYAGRIGLRCCARPVPWTRRSTCLTFGIAEQLAPHARLLSRASRSSSCRRRPAPGSRTLSAAPWVAWTIGMNTPSTSSVTSTVASAANVGAALRRIGAQRLAQEEPEPHRLDPLPGRSAGRRASAARTRGSSRRARTGRSPRRG